MNLARAIVVLPAFALAACALSLNGLSGGESADAGKDAPVGDHEIGPTLTSDADVPLPPALDADADAGTSYRAVVLADHPIAYFPFDEPENATSVTDVVAGVTGTVEGGGALTFGVPGIAGTTAVLADGQAYVDLGQRYDFMGESPWTVEAWVYPDLLAGQTFYNFVDKRDGTTNGLVVYVRNDQVPTIQLEQDWDNIGRGANLNLPAIDHYIHVVFTFQPGVGVRPWADGFKGAVGYDADGGPAGTTTPFTLLSTMVGRVDEIALYDYPLSDDQIAAHYAAGRTK